MHTRKLSVAVIGDGVAGQDSRAYGLAESFGERLVDAGFRVLTGGLGGVMEAACCGARRSAAYQAGDTIGILPGHAAVDANSFVDIAIPTELRHARNLIVAQADAVVAVGAGAGTLSEMALAWIFDRLILAFRIEGWSGKLASTRIDQRVRFQNVQDDQVFGVDSPEEAVSLLKAKLPLYTVGPIARQVPDALPVGP